MTPEDATFPRLECPVPKTDRYAYLKPLPDPSKLAKPKYFFALDLYQCAHLLPRLIGSIIDAMRFLGPENCALSIVEGRSVDGTFEILSQLRPSVEGIGSRYFFETSDINPAKERIKALAELRNMAVKPLVDKPDDYSKDTTVIFLNDIALCMEDILEIIHQRVFQDADMTCAMDWTYVGPDPTFYDVWIARGMTGDSFFNIPPDGSWDWAWDLFWNDSKSKARLQSAKPFQVFSCWNGITAFTAKPLMKKEIKFREHYKNECFQGEPKLFCKDMWHHGYGKIAVIPSVNVEYSDDAAKRIKALKGYTSALVQNEGDDVQIQFDPSPPAEVKCMCCGYENQTFIPWDEGLPKSSVAS